MCWVWVPPLKDGACHDEHLHAPVLRAASVLVLHVSPKGRRGGAVRVCWAWVPPLEDDDGKDKHLHAPVLRGAQHALLHILCHVLRHVLRCVLYVPVVHLSPKGRPRTPDVKARGRFEKMMSGAYSSDCSMAVYNFWTDKQTNR